MFPSMTPPLDWMFEMTGTFGGDRLAAGRPASTPATLLTGVPNPSFANQRFCGLVELVNGYHAEVYVPTAAERTGDFSAYPAPITDPETGQPFAGNTNFGSRLDDVYAFRVRLADPLVYNGAVADHPPTAAAVCRRARRLTLTSANDLPVLDPLDHDIANQFSILGKQQSYPSPFLAHEVIRGYPVNAILVHVSSARQLRG